MRLAFLILSAWLLLDVLIVAFMLAARRLYVAYNTERHAQVIRLRAARGIRPVP
jgi:hypothetical protein